MAKQYWVRHRGKMTGPFSGQQLKQMAAIGIIEETDQISADQNTWTISRKIKGLIQSSQELPPHHRGEQDSREEPHSGQSVPGEDGCLPPVQTEASIQHSGERDVTQATSPGAEQDGNSAPGSDTSSDLTGPSLDAFKAVFQDWRCQLGACCVFLPPLGLYRTWLHPLLTEETRRVLLVLVSLWSAVLLLILIPGIIGKPPSVLFTGMALLLSSLGGGAIFYNLSRKQDGATSVRGFCAYGGFLAGTGLSFAIALSGGSGTVRSGTTGGLDKDSLRIAAHTLYGAWVENDDSGWGPAKDKLNWTGSAGVYAKRNGKLLLFTNSHCLGLGKLATSDADGYPEVQGYTLTLRFASGIQKRVSRFADQYGKLDLAKLEVDADGLVEGRDYVILRFDETAKLSPLDAVVAVGSPHGLESSQTPGTISHHVRPRDPKGHECQTIQIGGAAIDHGNSGGPLFKKQDGRFFWVGVNTWSVGKGLGFAIHVKELMQSQFYWYECNKYGAAQAIRRQYKVGANPYP